MAIILGIDPGSRVTGYGVIRQQGRRLLYIGSGCIRTQVDDLPSLSLIHISEPTRQAEISYAVFCLKKKKKTTTGDEKE